MRVERSSCAPLGNKLRLLARGVEGVELMLVSMYTAGCGCVCCVCASRGCGWWGGRWSQQASLVMGGKRRETMLTRIGYEQTTLQASRDMLQYAGIWGDSGAKRRG